jgi:hypothetical protein
MATKFTPVTDPQEVEELTTDVGDLGKPFPFKPNGHLWVDTDELHDWREGRK